MIRYYSLFDKKVSKYINLFSARNNADAERIIRSQFKLEGDNMPLFVQFPEDFRLDSIIDFDEDAGTVKEIIDDILSMELASMKI